MIIVKPAQLNDIIANHPSDVDLGDVEVLVLDEVDCLLQMGFEPQVARSCVVYVVRITLISLNTVIDDSKGL